MANSTPTKLAACLGSGRIGHHFVTAAQPAATWSLWVLRPKLRGASQLSSRRPATHTGLACSNGEVGRSGSPAPVDCVNRGAESRCVASSASKGWLLGRTCSLATAHVSVLCSHGIRRCAARAVVWPGIGAVALTEPAAAECRIVLAVSACRAPAAPPLRLEPSVCIVQSGVAFGFGCASARGRGSTACCECKHSGWRHRGRR